MPDWLGSESGTNNSPIAHEEHFELSSVERMPFGASLCFGIIDPRPPREFN